MSSRFPEVEIEYQLDKIICLRFCYGYILRCLKMRSVFYISSPWKKSPYLTDVKDKQSQ